MDWLSVARELPLGHKTRIPCMECGTDDNSLLVNHGNKSYNAYCFRCGQNPFEMKGEMTLAELTRIKELNDNALPDAHKIALPEDFTTEIPLQGRLWLYKAGITESVWRHYNIGYSKTLERVVLPVYDTHGTLIWFQCRALFKGQVPKYLQPSRDKSSVLFTSTHSKDSERVVIVEDILSAIRVGRQVQAVSLLGTKITDSQANYVAQFERVTTWLDGDNAGIKGAAKVRRAIGLLTTVDNIVTDKDPKLLSDEEIRRQLCLTRDEQ